MIHVAPAQEDRVSRSHIQTDIVLRVSNYSTGIAQSVNPVPIVNEINLSLTRGTILALVGESGSGKSFFCRSIFGLDGGWRSGQAWLNDIDLMLPNVRNYDAIGGRRAAMIFQNPGLHLDPLMSIGRHLILAIRRLTSRGRAECRVRAKNLLAQVGLSPEIMSRYPHELSGGMNQRAMIALALAGDPDLLIADEPTTALDATLQRKILGLLRDLAEKRRMAVVLVTHNLPLAAEFADEIAVMYAGRILEHGASRRVFFKPQHPYSRALIDAVPGIRGNLRPQKIDGQMPGIAERSTGCLFAGRCQHVDEQCRQEPPPEVLGRSEMVRCWHPLGEAPSSLKMAGSLEKQSTIVGSNDVLIVDSMTVTYKNRRPKPHLVHAVNNVSFALRKGEVLGIIGESGSGKSTLAKAIMGLVKPTSGSVEFFTHGRQSLGATGAEMIFQDALGSLNPKFTALQAVADALHVKGVVDRAERTERALAALRSVEFPPDRTNARPSVLSGGQAQRVAIARAIVTDPAVLVCDEPTSALDVSVQAQIIGLLRKLVQRDRLSLLFISHDLGVVHAIADRVLVMYRGEIVESGSARTILDAPVHPYARDLVASFPNPNAERKLTQPSFRERA